jgi:hypothetical protein
MPETPHTFSRKVCMADLFDEDDDDNDDMPRTQNKYNRNYSQNDNVVIAKNQQHFGHRKRIKP